MPRFYFHVYGPGFDAPDLVGKDCATLECAHKAAHRLAGDLVTTSLVSGKVPAASVIDVEDENLRPVLSLPLDERATQDRG